ncbi:MULTISPECIES: lytic murein transglycosylase [unclassified Serratia (in: enterobacteria)]|uniref:lytic murein transglycosylase n=1 Tax=unclassified Serratia (in: enterobacteria) TaxID=2647522 RepID=UPI003FA6AF4E
MGLNAVSFEYSDSGGRSRQSQASAGAARGIRLADGSALPASRLRSWVIVPDDIQGRAFLVYDNFRTLMHWNRSYYFAISVGMMADGIVQ